MNRLRETQKALCCNLVHTIEQGDLSVLWFIKMNTIYIVSSRHTTSKTGPTDHPGLSIFV